MSTRKKNAEHLHAAHERSNHLKAGRKEGRSKALVAEVSASRLAADEKTRELEPALLQTVWPEYGYMSALERTELFTRAYDAVYRQKYEQYRDFSGAARSEPIDKFFVRNTRAEMTALWHARQKADELGVRYDFFIRWAMETALKFYKKLHLPRPNQLWNRSMLKAISAQWNKECDTRVFMPKKAEWDTRFRACHFSAAPPQLAMLDVIERDVLRGSIASRPYRLKMYLIDQQMISESEARARFGDDLVADAHRLSDDIVVPEQATSEKPYRPPCLGLVENQDAPGCFECPIKMVCRRTYEASSDDLKQRFGSDDPRVAKTRRDTRERVRKFRQRAKAQSGAVALTG